MFGVVNDENERSAVLAARCDDDHRFALLHHNILALATDLLAGWVFQTRFAGVGVEDFYARVTMYDGRRTWSEVRFHVLGGIAGVRFKRQGTDLGDVRSIRRPILF